MLSRFKKAIITSVVILLGLLIWRIIRPINSFSVGSHSASSVNSHPLLVVTGRLKAKKCVSYKMGCYQEWQISINNPVLQDAYFQINWKSDNLWKNCWLCYISLDKQPPENISPKPVAMLLPSRNFFTSYLQKVLLKPKVFIPYFVENPSWKQCVRLNNIHLDDGGILNKERQQKLFHHYMGRCIDGTLLKAILADVSGFYMKRGYITTRPYLKKQTITDGQINISVLKGSVEDIVDAKTKKTNSRIKTAFAFQKGNVLNLRFLETSLEMMNRPASSDAKFEIKPGPHPGMSIVEIKIHDASAYHLKVGITSRKKSGNGDVFLTTLLSIDNPLNINDILTFRYNGSNVQREYQSDRAGELNYSFPIASYLLAWTGSRFSYRQAVHGINNTFLSNGSTDGQRLRVSKILMRDRENKFSAALSIYHKDNKNFLDNQRIDVSSYKTTLVQLDLINTWLQRWGQLTTIYSYYQGTDWFGARNDSFFSTQTGMKNQERLQFKKYTLDINLLFYLKDRHYNITSEFYLQHTGNLLFSNDKLTVGSDYTVRGYLYHSLYGNNAWYIRNNLTKTWIPGFKSSLVRSVSIFTGLDYGDVRCEVDNKNVCGNIYGATTGFIVHAKHLMASFIWSRPLKKITPNYGLSTLFRFDLTWTF